MSPCFMYYALWWNAHCMDGEVGIEPLLQTQERNRNILGIMETWSGWSHGINPDRWLDKLEEETIMGIVIMDFQKYQISESFA